MRLFYACTFLNSLTMACNLTQGIPLGCRLGAGGVKAVYIANLDSISATTISAGTITAIQMVSTKKFFTYAQEIEVANWTENQTTSDQNDTVFYEQDLTLVLFKPTATIKSELQILGQAKLAIIILDNIGVYHYMGYMNGVKLQPSKYESGTAFGDKSAVTLAFKAKETSFAPDVSSSIIAGIIA